MEVSAAGYESARETVRHGSAPTEHRIALAALKPRRQANERFGDGAVTLTEMIALVQVPPRYPRRAARLQIEGSVTVEFTVTPDGRVTEPMIVESDPPIFDQAALQAIVRWKFEPSGENGQAIEARARQRIAFGL